MEKLTGSQILELIEKKEISWDSLGEGYVNFSEYSYKFGKVETVDEYGGEGMGEKYYHVYHFVDHNVYIRIDGYYQSYNGAEFENAPYEVKPVQRLVTFYEV